MTKRIYLDPGHGGYDPGAQGHGLKEKDLVLDIAKRTEAYLEKYYDTDVRLTRTTDVFLSLTERTNLINAWKPDYSSSIHINAGGGRGFETFTYSGSYNNKSTDIAMNATVHAAILAEMRKHGTIYDRGEKQANFHMVREPLNFCNLTESLFIDNAEDAAKLAKSAFIQSVAEGHAKGIAAAVGATKKVVQEAPSAAEMVIVDENKDGYLWTYSSADWEDKAQKVKPGEAFTIKRTVKVDGYPMYQLKSGLYITAAPSLVTVKRK